MNNKKPLKYIAVLPSLVTLLNGFFGFMAIIYSSYDPELRWSLPMLNKFSLSYVSIAAWFIVLGMVADTLDGRVARASGYTSTFGGQLDSLCDAITFGAAPALLAYKLFCIEIAGNLTAGFRPNNPSSRLVMFTAVIYFACAIIRLARFNVENDTEESAHMVFSGLPSPAAAGLVVGIVIFHENFVPNIMKNLSVNLHSVQVLQRISLYALPFALFIGGLLMVSRIPYPHIVNKLIRSKRPVISLVIVFIAVLFALWNFNFTFLLGFFGFILYGLIVKLGNILKDKSSRDKAADENNNKETLVNVKDENTDKENRDIP